MTKFAGITPLSTPALADRLVGVTSGNVDYVVTLQQLINIIGKNSLFSNPYKFNVYRTSAYTAVASTNTALPFDTKTFDTGTNVDVATNKGRFTAPVAGFYFFTANIAFGSTTNHWIIAYLFKNGAQAAVGQSNLNAAGTINAGNTVSALLQLSAGDYVEAYYFDNNADGLSTGASSTMFTGFLMSAT